MKYQVGGITSWNQDCQQKYQQPQICRWYCSNGGKWRGAKESLDEDEDEWKNWLKDHGVWSHHFMVNKREKSGNGDRFYLLGHQNHCGWWMQHEIKTYMLLGRKAMTILDSMLKSRDISLLTKVLTIKAMVFPVVMYRCESWTTKKAEHQRINASELWCWRRLLRVPWTARRSNQSILKEISPEYFAQAPILRPSDVKCQLIGKDPDSRKDWRQKKGETEDEVLG